MTSYTASNFSALLNDADISDETMESIVDAAIDTLNLLGAETISNMSGVAGSKTVDLTSKQHGGVVFAVRQIYLGIYQKPQSSAIAGQSLTVTDVLANPTLIALLEKVAERLSEIPFIAAEDRSGIE